MLRNVFHLDDRVLSSIMVPRSDIDWLDASATASQCLARVAGIPGGRMHSWYPVCRDGLDDVVGIIAMASLLRLDALPPAPIGGAVEVASFVPETLTALEMLDQLRTHSRRIVFVVDEYGVVQGLITPHDLLEAITGELKPAQAADAWATRREDGAWVLDGMVPVSELKARLGVDGFPDEGRGRYNTLAGLLMAVTGHLPERGERIAVSGWIFEVVELENRRIARVVASSKLRNPNGKTEA